MPDKPTSETTSNHRWHLQSQNGDRDWRTHINAARPMSLDDAEAKRWQAMEMFEGHRWRVLYVVTTTTVETTVIRQKEKRMATMAEGLAFAEGLGFRDDENEG